MNLDDLMEVWRSQDAAPLHGVNETLLRLALRQDEATLQKHRRRERWIIYLASAGLFAAMAFFFLVMLYPRTAMTGWDFAIPIVGAADALVMGVALYLSRRAQRLREGRFGDSLRDRLGRRIAQLDYDATKGSQLAMVLSIAIFVGAAAFLLAGWRINHKSFTDDGSLLFVLIAVCAFSIVANVWQTRRLVQRDILPRKRQLESMLRELDAA